MINRWEKMTQYLPVVIPVFMEPSSSVACLSRFSEEHMSEEQTLFYSQA
ncbi:hypothetical protein HMPREF0454_03788 [Hafnia alvei ATCC 51873]|uniref:Uncharacterized protein n=1 Tax=Hafnia alvei ATCC 51873 TaxID=1002364 RepID=G9YB25_HAFAL|nr:hypothetical protein HMPREF0454_03788 [Hafnia alvei ATCC 51873]